MILWGLKTIALFDVWTFEHILSGVSVGNLVKKKHKKSLLPHILQAKQPAILQYADILLVLLIAFAWEALEHYLEMGIAGQQVAYWFQGVEHWSNRLISDPLMLVLGYMIAKKYPKIVLPARILSVIWLIVHVFIFPHSMYLHEVFGI